MLRGLFLIQLKPRILDFKLIQTLVEENVLPQKEEENKNNNEIKANEVAENNGKFFNIF